MRFFALLFRFFSQMAKGLRPKRSLRQALHHEIAMYGIAQVHAASLTPFLQTPPNSSLAAFMSFYPPLPTRR